MTENEIREIVKQTVKETVKATLRELFFDDFPRTPYREREHEFFSKLNYRLNDFSSFLSDFERKWDNGQKCQYDKKIIDSIKDDTKKIK